MFTRARLHLTLLYAALLGVTVVLIAGAIGYLAVQEARSTDDRELKIRATAMASAVPPGPAPTAPSGPPSPLGGASDRGGNDRGPNERGPRPEEQGLLEYFMPYIGGQLRTPPSSALPGLPDLAAAQQAVATKSGSYSTDTVEGSQVRLYTLPVVHDGQVVAVVQVARSQYFVNAAVTRLALISLAAGLVGLVLSGGAGYWLAGRTLRPIAQAMEQQRNFAADASHELRTPLTVLLTNAELLARHPERRLADYQDVIEDMTAEIERLSRLVTGLLTLARADQGKAMLDLGPVNLADLALTVARQFEPIARAKGLVLQSDVGLDVVVHGDRDRLQQLIVILVDNAVRYTPSGSVTIRVAQRGNDALLAVSDTGPGIATEHQPHLFERFYRTDAARSAEEGGTGLGLALAEWIVKSHGGRIEVDSAPGRGSTFTVHLAAERSSGRGSRHPVAAGSAGTDAE